MRYRVLRITAAERGEILTCLKRGCLLFGAIGICVAMVALATMGRSDGVRIFHSGRHIDRTVTSSIPGR